MIGCVAVIPSIGGNFIGINCAKGRGLLLPGGGWEPNKDPTYHHAAAREAFEETGLIIDPDRLRYLWHGPDGYDHTTFAFLCPELKVLPEIDLPEGKPCIVSPLDTYMSKFAAWYRCLFEICHNELWQYIR